MHRADVAFQQVAGGARQVLDHPRGDDLRARCQLAVQADQLLLQQREGLRHLDQHVIEGPHGGFAGRDEAHRAQVEAVAREVLAQGEEAQVRIAAAGDLNVRRQARGEGAEGVVEDQHPALRRHAPFVQLVEQVFVGGVERLEGLAVLLGLADQVELGEGGGE